MTDTDNQLDLAFEAYSRGDYALGRELLGRAVSGSAVLQHPAAIITPIRNFASRLMADAGADPLRAVDFVDTLLTYLPDTLAALRNFHNTEMAAIWVDVAFRAYALGRLDLVRRAVTEAVSRVPTYALNRGVVSIWVEAVLGRQAAANFRDMKPGALVRRITHWRRRVILDRYFAGHSIRKLHMGCGGFLFPGWINADLSPFNRGGVIHMDATEPLPVPDGALDYVFSEHFIEHLTYAQGCYFLAECFRVLKPGGVCRLATPNLAFLVEVYSNPQGQLADYARSRFIQWVGGDVYSRALVLNNAFRNWGHQCLYDVETLVGVLRAVGFSSISLCRIGRSCHSALQNLEKHSAISDPQFNALETMVLEAEK